MGHMNPILTAANAYLAVTNVAGAYGGVQSFPGIPLGTPSDSPTGPICVKVMVAGSLPAGTAVIGQTIQKQFSTSSNSTLGITNATVFTLAAGERGFIQNLDDAALAVKYGAGATTSDFTFILKAGTAADDGLGGSVIIDDWIGPVSVIAMAGAARYLATKLS